MIFLKCCAFDSSTAEFVTVPRMTLIRVSVTLHSLTINSKVSPSVTEVGVKKGLNRQIQQFCAVCFQFLFLVKKHGVEGYWWHVVLFKKVMKFGKNIAWQKACMVVTT